MKTPVLRHARLHSRTNASPLSILPEALLAEGFRRAVFAFLVKERSIADELRTKLLGWRYCGGFSAHNRVRVASGDREGRIKLTGYMIRAPTSLEKMPYDAVTGTVIYRSKMHLGLKRNFQVMPGAQWLELLCKHIPDRHEHLVRYVGLCGTPHKWAGIPKEAPPFRDPLEATSICSSRPGRAWTS